MRKGPMASVTSTLATLVRVKATMKAVNITLQHRPDHHRVLPARTMRENTPCPCMRGRSISKDSAVNKLRQKVISKLRACSS